jgi:hypothetical protein
MHIYVCVCESVCMSVCMCRLSHSIRQEIITPYAQFTHLVTLGVLNNFMMCLDRKNLFYINRNDNLMACTI